jgi:hypothetical protein
MAAPKVIWVDAAPRDPATGAAGTFRAAGGGADMPYRLDGNDYLAGVADLPTVVTALTVPDELDFGDGAIPQALAFTWRPSSSARLAAAAALYWGDAAVTIRLGPEGSAPASLVAGKALNAIVDDDALVVTMSDPAAAFALPVLVDKFAGTGGAEGPADWSGRIKRRAWGRCFNVEALPIDKANQVYCVAHPGFPLQSIDTIRDGGRATDPALIATVNWAGSIAATFAALQAAAAPAGGGVVAPSIACIKWWTDPQSSLTVDLHGEVGAAYVETAAEISERVVQARGGPAFAAGEVAASKAARPEVGGLFVDAESYTVGNALAFLLGGTSQLWTLNPAGAIVVRRWAWGAAVASFKSQAVARRRMFKPVKARTLKYHQNNKTMARGDIVSVVLTSIVDARLSRDNVTVPADSSGNLAAGVLDAAGGNFVLKLGNDDVSAGATFSVLAGAVGGTATIDAAGAYKPLTMTSSSLVVTFRANYGGVDYDRVYTLTKAPAGTGGSGSPGLNAKLIHLINDRDQITYDGSGALSPSLQPVTFTVEKTNLSSATVTIALTDAAGTTLNANTYLTGSGTVTPSGNTFTMTGVTLTLSAANFNTARGSTEGVIVSVSHVDGVGDKADILRALAGAPGSAGGPGSPGANAKTIYVRSDRQIITYDGAGAISPSTQTTTFTAVKQNTSGTVTWTMKQADGTAISAASYLSATTGDSVTMTAAAFDAARGSTLGVSVIGTITADGIGDEIGVVRSANGAPGSAGAPGAAGNTVRRIYKRAASVPATPTGNLTPSGWSTTLPAADGNSAYASDGLISGADNVTLIGVWTDPALFEAVGSGGGGAPATYGVNQGPTVVLDIGQTVSIDWSYGANWTSGSSSIQGQVAVSGGGSGAILVGDSLALNSSEPFESDSRSGTYTNTSGTKQPFTFTFQVTGGGGRTYSPSLTWMTVS